MDELLARLEPTLLAHIQSPSWLVGFSGGLDSTVLLQLLYDFLRLPQHPDGVPELRAAHIHHGLSASADAWQRHCETFCRERHISFAPVAVDASNSRGQGPEAAAREARYGAFDQLQQPGEVLFLGHHLDDQLETMVLKLFRSSGISGLSAMAAVSDRPAGRRVRPLLEIPRAELLDYAGRRGLAWIEDDSNSDESLSRNFVRRRLLPVIEQHWPDYRPRLAALNKSLGESAALLAELAQADMQAVAAADRWGSYLRVEALAHLSAARLQNLVTHWLHGAGVATLRQRQWPQFFHSLLHGESGELVLGEAKLRRFRQAIYLVQGHDAGEAGSGPSIEGQCSVALPHGDNLRLELGGAVGLRLDRSYEVRYRQGGERVQGAGWQQGKSLKQYLQELGVPPWYRDKVPLLFCGRQMAAVADYCICDGFQAPPGERGATVHWDTGTMPAKS